MTATTPALPPPCPLCDASAETALATGRAIACPCGAEYVPPRPAPALGRLAPRPRSPRAVARRPEPRAPDLGVIVYALLRAAQVEETRERASTGGASPLAFVLLCLELGAVIPGSGRGEPDLAHLPDAPPIPALPWQARQVADAIQADGQGDQLVGVPFGRRVLQLSLEQRVGWALASESQRGRWAGRIAAGDSAPATTGMREAGERALAGLVRAWSGQGEARAA